MKIYDSLVIGGGPAGLSAAIYLARYNRSCLVVDMGGGRSANHEINENYLGFPKGIHIEELRKRGQRQAERFGALFVQDKATKIKKQKDYFEIEGGQNRYLSKTVIIATGVTDLWPDIKDLEDYLGKSLFWCITCDGHKTIGKKIVIIGDDNGAAGTAMQFLNFTRKVDVVTNKKEGEEKIDKEWFMRLKNNQITIYRSRMATVNGKNGYFQNLILETGEKIDFKIMINQQGSVPNSELAKEIGVEVDKNGYIKTDHEKKTNIPFLYAAGDVTSLHSHQVVIAAAEGAVAGETANYELYKPEQRF